jgi:hypothetical protein
VQVFGETEQFYVVSCVYDEDLSKRPVVGKTTVIEVTRASAKTEDEESKYEDQDGIAELERMLGELSLGRGLDAG